MASDPEIHNWAQRALDKFNGTYSASDINLNALLHLYGIRDDGNDDPNLAIASHYLHCRYLSSVTYVVGGIIGTVLALGYDGAIKWIDTLVKAHWNKELVHKFGKGKTSVYDPKMLAWDFQGLSDGIGDFMLEWGNTTLYASKETGARFQLRP